MEMTKNYSMSNFLQKQIFTKREFIKKFYLIEKNGLSMVT
jgi:hypothetical protein